MTLNERINKFDKKLLKLSMDHGRLKTELPDDRHYHEGKSDLAEMLKIEFKALFKEELEQYTVETGKLINT
jgi:hypothetical protein